MDPASESLSPAQSRGALLPRVQVAGQELTLFVESDAMIEALAADILAAQRRVWIEVYIFANDAGGRRIAELLSQKARAGLDVRVLYDAVGSQATPSSFFLTMIAAGVQVHSYHSFWYALRRLSPLTIFNRRDHRKLFVVDEQVSYFGGMNLTDTLPIVRPGAGIAGSADEAGGWRDLHVRMLGPQSADVAESFDRAWRRAHHLPVERRPRAYRRGQLPGRATEFIRFFDSGPGLKNSRAERIFRRLFKLSRQSVLISMAYFLPTWRMLRAIFAARRRGATIQVIVPGNSDVKLVRWASRYLYPRLLRGGIELYERELRMLHSKMIVVDGTWSVVGSCNLDPRSLDINLEFVAVIRSAELADLVTRIHRDD
jgi:cardiolipin synthase